MKVFTIILVMLSSSACSILPIQVFEKKGTWNTQKFKQLSKKYISIYPDETYSGDMDTSYSEDFFLPENLKDCSIELVHEVTHYRSRNSDAFYNGISIGSLGIIPYSREQSFKTNLTVTSRSNKSLTKEITSDKIKIRFGLFYIPSFIGAFFKNDIHLTNDVTTKMYSYQVSQLGNELRDFDCN